MKCAGAVLLRSSRAASTTACESLAGTLLPSSPRGGVRVGLDHPWSDRQRPGGRLSWALVRVAPSGRLDAFEACTRAIPNACSRAPLRCVEPEGGGGRTPPASVARGGIGLDRQRRRNDAGGGKTYAHQHGKCASDLWLHRPPREASI